MKRGIFLIVLLMLQISMISADVFIIGSSGKELSVVGGKVITFPYTPPSPTETPAPSGSGGVSVGAVETCTYDWVCSEWYPEPCPPEGIQRRICVNRGSCEGIKGMPSTIRTCTPEFIAPSEPLFDIFLKIPIGQKWILKGDTLEAQIELINVGNITTIDVIFKYWIVDENNRLILEKQETRAIGEREKFSVWFPLSDNLKPGVYKIYVHITYDDGKVAIAGDSFEIFENTLSIIKRILFLFVIPLLIIIGLVIIFFKIFKKRKKIRQKWKIKFRRLLRAKREKRREGKIKKVRKKETKKKRKYWIKRREKKRRKRKLKEKRKLQKPKRKKKKIPKHKKSRVKAKSEHKKEELHSEVEELRKKMYEELLKDKIKMKKMNKKIPEENLNSED
ncbi:hypothetical protein DRN69_06480 [Candidatus Pacearchaeota archaeon]|nr:MAG: hypothetical protein DRN69_06480 [Candidatus Pacearchaeota archaeon]